MAGERITTEVLETLAAQARLLWGEADAERQRPTAPHHLRPDVPTSSPADRHNAPLEHSCNRGTFNPSACKVNFGDASTSIADAFEGPFTPSLPKIPSTP